MIASLSQPYSARDGAPTVDRVDVRIFALTFFHDCMSCSFCFDSCCQHGATVEAPKVQAILNRADELEPIVGIPRELWFDQSEWYDDPDYPGGRFVRTMVHPSDRGPRCVFANTRGRGCLLHSHALESGNSVYDLKPLACSLFPVLFESGQLIVPLEIDDQTLVCIGQGMTLYRSARNDLLAFFGPDLVAELDELELIHGAPHASSRGLSLPLTTAS